MARRKTIIGVFVGWALVGCAPDKPTDGSPGADTGEPALAHAPEYRLEASTQFDFGGIWCVPVWDGNRLVVSTENGGTIQIAAIDSALNVLTEPVRVAGHEDTLSGDGIADHKHIFQGGYHYFSFSISGGGQGGELYLVKLDMDFNRVGIETVVSDAPPTNDMFMVGDGAGVHVGKFLPGRGHQVYSFDADLQPTGDKVIGEGPQRDHANGASAWYADDQFVVVAPATLAPGEGDVFYRLHYDAGWEGVGERKTILEDEGMLTIVSGLSLDPNSGAWLVHYARSPSHDGGDIHLASFDENWELLDTRVAVEGTYQRPHSVVVGEQMYLGYDGGGAFLSRFSYVGALAGSPD